MYVDECNDIEISKPWVIILIVVGSGWFTFLFKMKNNHTLRFHSEPNEQNFFQLQENMSN